MWFQVLSQAAVRDGVELDSTARGEWPLSAAGSSIGFFSSASLEQPLHQLYTCSVLQLSRWLTCPGDCSPDSGYIHEGEVVRALDVQYTRVRQHTLWTYTGRLVDTDWVACCLNRIGPARQHPSAEGRSAGVRHLPAMAWLDFY